MSDSKNLQIGVIGVGGRGWIAYNAHRPDQGMRVVAGADVNEAAFEKFLRWYGRDTFVTADYRRVLDRADVNVVFVTSPDYLHEEHAVAALRAGKDVYLEKPMAITIDGCLRILQAARDNGRKLYLGHNMRHMTFVLKMKHLIDSGAIGEVKVGWCRHFVSYGGEFFAGWHAERAKSTGLLLQKGTHDIDILHWLCGGYSKRVHAMGGLTLYGQITDRRAPGAARDAGAQSVDWPPLALKQLNPIIDIEDVSMMQMRLDNGVLASYQQCNYTPDAWRNYTIIGSEGRIENFGDRPGECVVRLWNRRTGYNPYGDEQYFMPPVASGHGGADDAIVEEFVRYVREGAKITTSAVAAYYSVAAGCMATLSLRGGGEPLDVPALPEGLAAYFTADVKA